MVDIIVNVNLSTTTTGIIDVRSEAISITSTISRWADSINMSVPYICVVIVAEKLAIAM